MAQTTRPWTHAQREVCIAALDAPAASTLPPLATAALNEFRPARDVYAAARAAHRAAVATRDEARTSAAKADADFDRGFRCWASTVVDADGKVLRDAIAGMLGGVSPGVLVTRPYRDEVVRTADLLVQLKERPSLSGDPARLAELHEVHRVLTAATDAVEAAVRAEREAATRLKATVKGFDREWGKVVKALQLVLGNATAAGVLPKFVRSSKRSAAASAPTVEPGPEPDPEPSCDDEPEADTPAE